MSTSSWNMKKSTYFYLVPISTPYLLPERHYKIIFILGSIFLILGNNVLQPFYVIFLAMWKNSCPMARPMAAVLALHHELFPSLCTSAL